MRSRLYSLLLLIGTLGCGGIPEKASSLHLEHLDIAPLTEHLYTHTSYLDIPDYGKFPCNGVVYVRGEEAIVFDTPIDGVASKELIDWLLDNKAKRIVGVVVNHFHNDCLGGVEAFSEMGIPIYASDMTIALARGDGSTTAMIGFDERLELSVADRKTITVYPGPAHTVDNVVSYIPSEKALFGGCMIKAQGAGKGNLADADVEMWPVTVSRVEALFPDARIVVPGHGKWGGRELLKYTIDMFADR